MHAQAFIDMKADHDTFEHRLGSHFKALRLESPPFPPVPMREVMARAGRLRRREATIYAVAVLVVVAVLKHWGSRFRIARAYPGCLWLDGES